MRELDVLNVRYARIWCPLPTVGRHPHDLLLQRRVQGSNLQGCYARPLSKRMPSPTIG